jgi:hypothetical protein
VRLSRNPAGALADVIDGAARSFHGVLMEADFPIMSGMEAALKFRAVPLSAGWGKARPLIVMVVNGSPLANYQVRMRGREWGGCVGAPLCCIASHCVASHLWCLCGT